MPPEQVKWAKLKHGDPLTSKFTSEDGLTSAQMIVFDLANTTHDPVVEKVREKLLQRSQVGIKKYGTTIWNNTDENYLKHLQDELLDGANYCEQQMKLGVFTMDMIILIENTPNDAELGNKIRSLYMKMQNGSNKN